MTVLPEYVAKGIRLATNSPIPGSGTVTETIPIFVPAGPSVMGLLLSSGERTCLPVSMSAGRIPFPATWLQDVGHADVEQGRGVVPEYTTPGQLIRA